MRIPWIIVALLSRTRHVLQVLIFSIVDYLEKNDLSSFWNALLHVMQPFNPFCPKSQAEVYTPEHATSHCR
jgi:hypothetical protein